MREGQFFGNSLAAFATALAEAGGGSPAIKIGVVDGLPDLAHPALANASIDILKAMIPEGGAAPDPHGTQICSLLFGSGDTVQGLAPNCSGLVLPIFLSRRSDTRIGPASQLDLARATSFALERGVSILNVSAGQKTSTPEAESHLGQALERCAERRVLVVAAAGNDGCACVHLPAIVDFVLAVGALDAQGRPLPASNFGEAYRRNGILAPGEGLSVAVPGGKTGTASGTSFATAIVTGVAALLLSIALRERYRLDAIDIRSILMESASPCTLDGPGACDRYLAGTLDPAAALALLHRIGASPGVFIAPVGADDRVTSGLGHPMIRNTGDVVMLETSSDATSIASMGPPGITPSACACGCKDEQNEESNIAPQAMAGAAQQSVMPEARGAMPSAPARLQRTDGLYQQACSCGGGEAPQIVYALGSLWFDFGTEARYDALVQQLGGPVNVNNPATLFAFLRENPQFHTGITYILMQDQIPLYAVQPAGPFAAAVYDAILDALTSSLDENTGREQRISLPGYVSGSTRLMNGMTVPVVFPDLRGMYKWRSADLIEATRTIMAAAAAPPPPAADEAVLNFLNRVYYELRNLGIAPQERAMNYAATNAYQAREAFADMTARNMELDTIKVVKSPICRPDSDCWDVQLSMFDPENERRANRVYRYTVDVSEVLPVTVGAVRTWAARAGA